MKIRDVVHEVLNEPDCSEWSSFICPFQRFYFDTVVMDSSIIRYHNPNRILVQNELIYSEATKKRICNVNVTVYEQNEHSSFLIASLDIMDLNRFVAENPINDRSQRACRQIYTILF